MPKGLKLLVMKEIKDLLRDPKILIGMILFPALILPLMGGAVSIATTSTYEKAAGNITAYIIDDDNGAQVPFIMAALNSTGITPQIASGTPEELARSLGGGDVIVCVPAGFSQNVSSDQKASLQMFINFKDFSIYEFVKSGRVDSALSTYEEMLIGNRVSEGIPGASSEIVLNPLSVGYESVIKGEAQPVSPSILQNTVRMQGMMGPIVIMLVLILAMQVAATSMAVEKEAKTLETLLTIPVSRLSILFGKLAGSVTIAFLATVANVFAFTYYMNSLLGSVSAGLGELDLAAVGLVPSVEGYAVLGLTLFGSLISALALALTLGTLSQDVRGAQSMIGILMVPVLLPTIFLMMGDISTLPAAFQTILYLIPFTYPVLASQALFTGNYGTILLGLAYTAAFTFGTLYIAAKVFSTEKVMTAKINFGKSRLRNSEQR